MVAGNSKEIVDEKCHKAYVTLSVSADRHLFILITVNQYPLRWFWLMHNIHWPHLSHISSIDVFITIFGTESKTMQYWVWKVERTQFEGTQLPTPFTKRQWFNLFFRFILPWKATGWRWPKYYRAIGTVRLDSHVYMSSSVFPSICNKICQTGGHQKNYINYNYFIFRSQNHNQWQWILA